MKDLGPVSFALGMRVQRDRKRRIVYLDQQAFCDEILTSFDMQNCKPCPTPQVEKQYLTKAEEGYVADPQMHNS